MTFQLGWTAHVILLSMPRIHAVLRISEWKWMEHMSRFIDLYTSIYTKPFRVCDQDMLQGWWKVLRDENHSMTGINLSTRFECLNSVGLHYEPPDCRSSQTRRQGCGRHPDSPLFSCSAKAPPGKCLSSSSNKWVSVLQYPKHFLMEGSRWSV